MPTKRASSFRLPTHVSALQAFAWGLLFTGIIYLYLFVPRLLGSFGMSQLANLLTGVVFLSEQSYLWQLFCDRGMTQPLCVFSFFSVMSLLAKKARILKRQSEAMKSDPLPLTIDIADPGAAVDLHDRLQQDPRVRTSLLHARLDNLLSLWLSVKDPERVTSVSQEMRNAEMEQARSSYLLPRLLIGVMLILGTIGTVVSLDRALSSFPAVAESRTSDAKTVIHALAAQKQNQEIAFDSILVAVVFAAVAFSQMTVLKNWENSLLGWIDFYAVDRFVSRLKAVGKSE